jgi:hypothetical protein
MVSATVSAGAIAGPAVVIAAGGAVMVAASAIMVSATRAVMVPAGSAVVIAAGSAVVVAADGTVMVAAKSAGVESAGVEAPETAASPSMGGAGGEQSEHNTEQSKPIYMSFHWSFSFVKRQSPNTKKIYRRQQSKQ